MLSRTPSPSSRLPFASDGRIQGAAYPVGAAVRCGYCGVHFKRGGLRGGASPWPCPGPLTMALGIIEGNMRASRLLGAMSGLIILCCTNCSPRERIHMSGLPSIEEDLYKVDPCIDAAVALQQLGREKAIVQLHKMAGSRHPWPAQRVTILCRMLFTNKSGSLFRSPVLGYPYFLDSDNSLFPPQERSEAEWPLVPIELVDGVPFLVVRLYWLNGLPERDEDYLRYCEMNCAWSSFRYSLKTAQEKQDALNKLINSPKWKSPLDEKARAFLANQLQ